MDIPRDWHVCPDLWQAESTVASVKYRSMPNGTVQVYWIGPKIEMTESEAASVAAVAEVAIRDRHGSLTPRPLL
jgi:hypothetical protein